LKALAVAFAATLVLSACAPSPPPAPPPLDPTGIFDITANVQGMQVRGTVTIRGTEGAYTGSIDTDIGSAGLAEIVVEENRVTFSVPEAGVFMAVVYEGDGFSGTIEGAMGAGNIVATKRSAR